APQPHKPVDKHSPPSPLSPGTKKSRNPQLSRRINGEDGDPTSHRP
nr:hypothetical protein [Tanacetum cinerariifolium]